ncbi:MAG: hypothetical protein QXV22_00310 [Thermoplasmataceae archaeon]
MIIGKDQVLEWLAKGEETSGNLADIPWQVRDSGKFLVLENPRLPFSIFMVFENSFIRIFMRTGIETAVIENRQRLAICRVLLILNSQIDLVKFMLDGLNEEVVSRVDLDLENLTKEEMNDGMNMLLSSLFLMVQALHLEDEFRERVRERTILMIQDMLAKGKKPAEIRDFLTRSIGISQKEAESLLSRFIMTEGDKSHSEMYG